MWMWPVIWLGMRLVLVEVERMERIRAVVDVSVDLANERLTTAFS